MNIVVCGDSFCSADRGLPGTHFSEILRERGHSVTNLARGGASNTLICFQIQQAVQLNPDLIISTSTGSERLDVPMPGKKFIESQGLKNFSYPYHSDTSYGNALVGGADAAIWSDVVAAMVSPRPDTTMVIPAELVEAIKHYLVNLHSHELHSVRDKWLLDYWRLRISQAGIRHIDLKNNPAGKIMYSYPGDKLEAIYHTDKITQQKIANEIAAQIE